MSFSDVALAVSGARPNASGWARGNCPLCLPRTGREDRKGCLAVHLSGRYVCWRCGAGGRLREPLRDDWADEEQARGPVEAMEPPEAFWPLCEGDGARAESFAEARRYLYAPPDKGGRGLSREACRVAKVGACLSGRFSGRVVVPVLADDGGTWLGWSSRVWYSQKEFVRRCVAAGIPAHHAREDWRSYMYPPGMPRGRVIYNHRALLVETDEPALVVEGVFDVLCDQVGLDRGAAVLGSPSPRGEQFNAFCAARRPDVFLLDGDAWRKAEALSLALRVEGVRSGFVRLPPKADPDGVDREWLDREARESLEA